MRWLLYNTLFALALLAMLPNLIWRMRRRGGYGANFRQRFGRYTAEQLKRFGDGGAIWIHAVSVGEVYVAGQLMRALRERQPAIRFVLSTTSSTGWGEAGKVVGSADSLIYNPLDFPLFVKRALAAIRPAAFILVETELWPNTICACARRNIPLLLVNGRMSDRTANSYRRLRFWFGPALRHFQHLLLQSQLDATRYLAAGADRATITVSGSFKFDVAQRNPGLEARLGSLLQQLDLAKAELLVGASTWPGEEELLLAIYSELRPCHPRLRLILVPRHFERRADVMARIAAAGLQSISKRELDEGKIAPHPLTADEVLLLDTTGELAGLYPHATIVFVGRSLSTSAGGQNMIEPCLAGVATLVGPNTQNFRPVISDLLAAEALLQVPDGAALKAEIQRLLSDPTARLQLGQRASQAVIARRGVVAHSADLILAAASSG